MEKMYVINFDEAIIFEVDKYADLSFYENIYNSFDIAKSELVAYWDNALVNTKATLFEVNNLKEKDAKTFIKS